MYLGDDSISEAYLGEDLVFSTGPFEGLKVTPKSLSFNSFNASTANIKIKSSEAWSMTVPAWITASTLTGDTGETIVSLTATTQTATTTGSIVVASANYSASASCFFLIGVPQLQIDGEADISTSFNPYAAYTVNSNYLKCEISAEWTGSRNSSAYLYACGGVPFFSCERFRTSDIPYCNIGNGDVSNGPENGGGLDHTWVFEVNGNAVTTYLDGVLTETKSISGSWPTGNLSFAKYSATNLHINFYWVKFWGANNTLLAEFVPDSSGGILDKVSNIVYPKVGTGTTSYSLVIPPAPPIPTGNVTISVSYPEPSSQGLSGATYILYATDDYDLDGHNRILASCKIKDEGGIGEWRMDSSAITDTGITSVQYDWENSILSFEGTFATGYTYAIRGQRMTEDHIWEYGDAFDENTGEAYFSGDSDMTLSPDWNNQVYLKELVIEGLGVNTAAEDEDGKFFFATDENGDVNDMSVYEECYDDTFLGYCPYSIDYDDTEGVLTVVCQWDEDTGYNIITKATDDAGCVYYLNEVSWGEGDYSATMNYGDGTEEPIDGCGE